MTALAHAKSRTQGVAVVSVKRNGFHAATIWQFVALIQTTIWEALRDDEGGLLSKAKRI
jgi:hypothetical protein